MSSTPVVDDANNSAETQSNISNEKKTTETTVPTVEEPVVAEKAAGGRFDKEFHGEEKKQATQVSAAPSGSFGVDAGPLRILY
jgi:hypothetical protein